MSNYKYNIFDILAKINGKKYNYYQEATREEQKAIAPLVLQRWLSGVSGEEKERQIMFLNEFVNPYVFNLYTHPDLLWKLMCVSTSGNRVRNTYPQNSKKQSSTMKVKVIKEYFKYSQSKAEDALKFLSPEDIIRCAQDLGYESADITKLKKEL